MMTRPDLAQSSEALMRARDLAIVLQFAAQQAEENGEEGARQFTSASTSLLAQIEELIRTAHNPIHDAIVDDNGRERRVKHDAGEDIRQGTAKTTEKDGCDG